MSYTPGPLPGDAPAYLARELNSIAEAFVRSVPFVILDKRYAAPPKPREGMTVLADGTQWNPGSGAGVYTYYSGAWVKLG